MGISNLILFNVSSTTHQINQKLFKIIDKNLFSLTFENWSLIICQVLEIMGSLPDTVKKLTGVDITGRIQAVNWFHFSLQFF